MIQIAFPYFQIKQNFSYWLIGWKIKNDLYCIATLLPAFDMEYKQVSLQKDSGCQVLGLLLENENMKTELEEEMFCFTFQEHIDYPLLIKPKERKMQVVLYALPNPLQLQFYSLKPLPLDISLESALSHYPADKETDKLEEKDNAINDHMNLLIAKMNQSFYVDSFYYGDLKSPFYFRIYQNIFFSTQKFFLQSQTFNSLWYNYLIPSFCNFLWLLKLIAEFTFRILEFKVGDNEWFSLGRWQKKKWTGVCLKDLSAFGQQLALRLSQLSIWPFQYLLFFRPHWYYFSYYIRKKKKPHLSQYIVFYNHLWLMINDILLGLTIGRFLIDNRETIVFALNKFLNDFTVHWLQETISWLMGWPAGLKLNRNLNHFLGELFLWLLVLWKGVLNDFMIYFLPFFVYSVGLAGCLGATFLIGLCLDLISLFSVHLNLFYFLSAKLYHWEFSILTSLFRLFRGRKYSVLRKRVDHAEYELDQLMIGTLFFTVCFFLVPTVFVYYLLFLLAQFFVFGLKMGLICIQGVLNHFPLFALMLRFKDPERLPGGIQFKYLSNFEKGELNISYLEINNAPIGLEMIFNQYFSLGKDLTRHFLSLKIIYKILVGAELESVHVLQYPQMPRDRMLPSQFYHLIYNELLKK